MIEKGRTEVRLFFQLRFFCCVENLQKHFGHEIRDLLFVSDVS